MGLWVVLGAARQRRKNRRTGFYPRTACRSEKSQPGAADPARPSFEVRPGSAAWAGSGEGVSGAAVEGRDREEVGE